MYVGPSYMRHRQSWTLPAAWAPPWHAEPTLSLWIVDSAWLRFRMTMFRRPTGQCATLWSLVVWSLRLRHRGGSAREEREQREERPRTGSAW